MEEWLTPVGGRRCPRCRRQVMPERALRHVLAHAVLLEWTDKKLRGPSVAGWWWSLLVLGVVALGARAATWSWTAVCWSVLAALPVLYGPRLVAEASRFARRRRG